MNVSSDKSELRVNKNKASSEVKSADSYENENKKCSPAISTPHKN